MLPPIYCHAMMAIATDDAPFIYLPLIADFHYYADELIIFAMLIIY